MFLLRGLDNIKLTQSKINLIFYQIRILEKNKIANKCLGSAQETERKIEPKNPRILPRRMYSRYCCSGY